MKTLNTLLVIIFAALTTAASSQNIRSNVPFLKEVKQASNTSTKQAALRATSVGPEETLYFEWNTALSQWDTVSLTFNTYSSPNVISSELILDYSYPAAKFDTSYFVTYTYNANGDLIEILTKDYLNNVWVNSMKEVFVYDSYNHLIESLTFYWDGTTWDLMEGDKSIITYDNNGLIIKEEMEYYEMSTNSWEKYQMNEIFYPAGVSMPDSILMYNYDNNNWVLDGKIVNLTWYDFSKLLFSSYEIIMMDNGSWGDPMRIEITYNTNDQVTSMIYKVSVMGNFIDFMKYTFTYDTYGNETESKVESFMTGTWEVFANEIHTYTYDNSGNMTGSEAKVYDINSSNWYNTEKYQYTYQGSTTGIEEEIATEVLKAFPNPFNSTLKVINEGFGNGDIRMTIFDIAGRIVHNELVSGGKTEVMDLKDLNNGIYFLNISTTEKTKTIKIVKH